LAFFDDTSTAHYLGCLLPSHRLLLQPDVAPQRKERPRKK
jgi:hypothetical protein